MAEDAQAQSNARRRTEEANRAKREASKTQIDADISAVVPEFIAAAHRLGVKKQGSLRDRGWWPDLVVYSNSEYTTMAHLLIRPDGQWFYTTGTKYEGRNNIYPEPKVCRSRNAIDLWRPDHNPGRESIRQQLTSWLANKAK
ncbi:hypothetical protein [Williamsia muralis]|uniref:hypothetical protein n=1 Tax=Williamsia marianensis TaxID=85044 RepID=UPI00381F9FE8